MRLDIELPKVVACEASMCAYNTGANCHARAITVGDGANPGCDTFLESNAHVDADHPAGVGACKVTVCKHNRDFQCQAATIHVGLERGDALCESFTAE